MRPLAGIQAPAAALAPSTPVGMFAPMTAAPAVAGAATPAEQMVATGRPAGMGVPAVAPGGYPGAGLTSYIKPADGFTSPQLTSGRPGSLAPGMLNAAKLRGPLTTTSTTAAQPLAYTAPPQPAPTPPQQAAQLADTGQALRPLQPPSQPAAVPPAQSLLIPPAPTTPPATVLPEASSPTPSTGIPGAGTTGVQMLGFGPGGAPQAPPFPLPLDPAPPIPPIEPKDMNPAQLRQAWDDFVLDRDAYNLRCGRTFQLPAEAAAYDACLTDLRNTTEREAALRQQFRDLGLPELPRDYGPGAAPQPGAQEPTGATQETPPFPPPREISGYTEHGAEQVSGRDGHGVNDSALRDAVTNPIGPPEFVPDQYGGTYKYVGKNATVAVNGNGQVVTAWANSRDGWRNP
jgi:hypothetical protein